MFSWPPNAMSDQSTIRIAILGDYRADNGSHVATNRSLQHAADALGLTATSDWLPTRSISVNSLVDFDAFLCSPGSPYESMDGALAGIRFARENDRVFLGTCGGFQHAVIEYARHVLGISAAEHEETSPEATTLFISRMACSLVGKTARVRITPGSRLGSIYGSEEPTERFWCNFGVNTRYANQLTAGGLRVSATDGNDSIRAIELPGHRFFIGTLFIPQLSSTRERPHPVINAFLQAAANRDEDDHAPVPPESDLRSARLNEC